MSTLIRASSPRPLRVYLVGAHSTGKTTLLHEVLQHIDMDVVTEVARGIIRERGWTNAELDPVKHPDVFEQLQVDILRGQCEAEAKIPEENDYICDRGCDPLVYAAFYLGDAAKQRMLNQVWTQQCLRRMQGSMVFLTQPHAACMESDHVRLTPNLYELECFTETMKKILTENSINFLVIEMLDLKKRTDFVISKIAEVRPDLLTAR